MALFNRFFGLRRKQLNKYQDNACEKLFAFTEDQVRIVVFRECDFRGRKLLFDSRSVEKVELPIPNPHCHRAEAAALHCDPQSNAKKYVEVCNGHGYMYTKPNSDVSRLGEMIFGSVAMSYRGTTSKLHVLQGPTRIVCSQVFPSPRYAVRPRNSAPSHVSSATASSLEQSVRLEDSGDSLATWSSEHSVHSNMSDTMLVCRRQRSVPLDVPANSSVVSSSGFGELSHSSMSSGPQSIPIDLSQGSTRIHSEDSFCRQWEQSTTSLPCSGSIEENFPKIHPRISKIGLAVLIQLTENEEDNIEHFLMEHALLLESLIWRARRGVEAAYVRHTTFVSTMHSVASEAARWLTDLMTRTRLASHVWHSLLVSNNCDSLFSITTKPSIKSEHLKGTLVSTASFPKQPYCSRSLDVCENGTFLNITRYLKSEGRELPSVAEKFVAEFCELLENIDAKDTNFFISTLVTAVLTHHLGWVSTVYSPSKVPAKTDSVLYHQLGELYGAVGSPVKLSRTIISGVTRTELIPKILNSLTYFIRCIEVERCTPHRSQIDFENNEADLICRARECIPKENYKRYEDHLREMRVKNAVPTNPVKKLAITKTYTCLADLSKQDDGEDEVDFAMLPEDIIEAKQHIERIVPRKGCPEDVVFVLGENEKLVGLKRLKQHEEDSSSDEEKHREKPEFENKASTSCSNLCDQPEMLRRRSKDHSRAQSEPPSNNPPTKYKYSGVKFNFQQYPQIFENYMRSKNIELASMRLPDKELDLEFPTVALESVSNGDGLDVGEPLTTPSNASELEFSSDLVLDKPHLKVASEFYEQARPKTEFRRALASNVLVKDADKLSRQKLIKDVKNHITSEEVGVRLRMVEFPMPKTEEGAASECGVSYVSSLLRGLGDRYIPDMVLQGTTAPKKEWHSTLKKDLVQSAQQPFMNRKVDESIAIVANIDTWEVQLMSSHTYVIDRNVSGVPVGMSQLVANMLDTLVHLWRLRTPAEFCILYIEQQLREVCLRSKALAQLLLDTDFCSIETLTSTLRLEVNDVPLLMAVASTHTPKVTEKYGLSFQ